MSFKRLTVILVSVALAAVLGACSEKTAEDTAPAQQEGIAWMGYTEGMAKAKETGKPVMVDFFTTWCQVCKVLDAQTFTDKELIELVNKNFIAVKVDAESSDTVTEGGKTMTKLELARSFSVSGYPTVWFIDSKGAKVGILAGARTPEEYKSVINYFASGAQAKGVSYPDYMKALMPAGHPAMPDQEETGQEDAGQKSTAEKTR
ncbi:MAG TPA: thioredoxin fold domain-containing protein [Nitrospirota bacterium]|jgi:thioredoxin-related protein